MSEQYEYVLRWTERMSENDGFGDESGVALVDRTITIEAISADDAQNKWDEEYANEGTNGLHSLHRVVKHPFVEGYIKVEVPNENTYAVSVDELLRQHATAEVFKDPSKNEDDIAYYIVKESIPFFENNTDALLEWAKAHTDWCDLIYENAVKQLRTPPKQPVDLSSYWKSGTHTFLANIE